MPSITAKRQCPDLIFVKLRLDVYKAVSQQIWEIFAEHTNSFRTVDDWRLGRPGGTQDGVRIDRGQPAGGIRLSIFRLAAVMRSDRSGPIGKGASATTWPRYRKLDE